jgi:uncharacterized membrane protein (DUF4010 family)
LPFLPNKNYGASNLLNPFEIGSIVVIVSFLNFIGYFLVKFVGSRKGILLTAILGGLISSTAVTWNYAFKSKRNPVIISHLAIPFTLLTIICLIPSILLIRKNSGKAATDIDLGNPLNVLNALSFALIYVVILYAVHYGNLYFGESGLYYSALIAGLADTTAITISMAKFGLNGDLLQLSSLVIIASTLSNTLVKLGISFLRGSKATGKL